MTRGNYWSIKKIFQKDKTTFTIEWNDNQIVDYRLSDLQKCCPCAQCLEEATGSRIVDTGKIDPLVQAKRIVSVGRYALRIEFTKGCSMGIYSFDMLRELAQ